jgi:preprotein translocase subunit SecA
MAGRGTDILLGGNVNYMARSALKIFLDAIFFNTPIEKFLNSDLKSLYNFLLLKIKNPDISEDELNSYITIACEKTFTNDPLIILFRAAYKILLEK